MHHVRGTCICLSQLGGWITSHVRQLARDPRNSIGYKMLHLSAHSKSQPATAKAFQRRTQNQSLVDGAGDSVCLSLYILLLQ